MTPKAIGICGGSCSGKTTLATHVFATLGPDQCVILPQDDYFFGYGDAPEGKGGPNFDHPDAVDFDKLTRQLAQLRQGQAIERPLYDFPTHMPKQETCRTEPRPIILVDGILILQHAPLREQFDLSVFVECEEEVRLSRRAERDVKERGRTADSVYRMFTEQVAPMHDRFVEPSKTHADIVVNSQQSKEVLNDQFEAIAESIKLLIQ